MAKEVRIEKKWHSRSMHTLIAEHNGSKLRIRHFGMHVRIASHLIYLPGTSETKSLAFEWERNVWKVPYLHRPWRKEVGVTVKKHRPYISFGNVAGVISVEFGITRQIERIINDIIGRK